MDIDKVRIIEKDGDGNPMTFLEYVNKKIDEAIENRLSHKTSIDLSKYDDNEISFLKAIIKYPSSKYPDGDNYPFTRLEEDGIIVSTGGYKWKLRNGVNLKIEETIV